MRKNSSKRLLQLSERLVSVTRSNKSIRLLRKTKAQCFDAAEVDALRNDAAAGLLRAIMIDKSYAVLTHRDSPVDPREARHELFIDEEGQLEETETPEYQRLRLFRKLDSTLVQLSRNTAAIEAETGAMDLYFGYPWLSGTCDDVDATFLQAPLLLYPVQIRVERSPRLQWFIEPRDDAQPVFNEALTLALQQYHDTKLSEEFISEAESAGDERELADDPLVLLDWFQTQLTSLGFRMTAPLRRVVPLPEYKAADVPAATEGFTLSAHTVVGYFPQAGSALRRDYEALMPLSESDALPPVLNRLLDTSARYEPTGDGEARPITMDEVHEADTCWIIPSDASQEAAMLKVRNQACTVIHGPPGTGKSQVICNLISDALSRNQKVLVCCQKRAALDVVFQRLEKEGLGGSLAVVHDHANDRQLLYARIAAALAPPDAKLVEDHAKEVDKLAKSIDGATAKLREIAEELHRPRRCGMSARQLYTLATRVSRPTDLGLLEYSMGFDADSLGRFAEALKRLRAEHAKLDEKADVWSGRTSFARLSFVDAERISKVLQSVAGAAETLRTQLSRLEEPRPSPEVALKADAALDELGTRLSAADEQLLDIAQANLNPTVAGTTKATLKALERLLGDGSVLQDRPSPSIQGGTLDEAAFLDVYNLGRRKLFRILDGGWRRARIASQQVLLRNGLTDSPNTVSQLSAQIRARHSWSRLDKAVEGTLLAPAVTQAVTRADLDSVLSSTLRALDLVSALAGFFKAWPQLQPCFESISGNFRVIGHRAALYRQLGQGLSAARASIKALSPYLIEKALAFLDSKASSDVEGFAANVRRLQEGLVHFEVLQRIDDVKDGLRPNELKAFRQLSKTDTNWPDVFTSAMYWGWLEEVEKQARTLRSVASGEVGDLRAQFRSELDRRRKLNALRLAAQLQQQATKPRFEPGRDVDGRHSESRPWTRLKDEVVKKRRIWPLRRLVHELRWPLMEVMPCWLVSPETLSSVFPLEENLFDLAIFDEASQLAVHYSVPAVFRSKRIVIAGDEQQLRPFDLFGALGVQSDEDDSDDDDSDASVTEHDSLLTLAKTRFPGEMLACHYRSRFEELIEFSNQGFYNGRLITMPSASGVGTAPIEWRKVTGIWEKRCNKAEATEVLNLVFELLKANDSRSIGVITFNSTQQVAILDQIDERSAEDPEFATVIAKAQHPPGGNRDAALFVKNIENVQGDERDVIVFSVGYAPDPSGRVYSRFGTLNKDGGDNRLNVAVSRAKERIYVVSSVEPEQLDVANSKNRGPRLLRSYLSYAKAVASHAIEQRDAVLRDVNPDLDRRVKQTGHFDSQLEEEIYDTLSGRGLTLVPQVGVSGYRIDLGIVDPRDPTRYVLGIECDGAAYHSAISARERDAYRQRFLESRGWKIHRIWSRNWWRDKDAEIRAVMELLKQLV